MFEIDLFLESKKCEKFQNHLGFKYFQPLNGENEIFKQYICIQGKEFFLSCVVDVVLWGLGSELRRGIKEGTGTEGTS